MKAIARMLTVNHHLAYLDVLMLTDHRKYGNPLKKYHLKPIDRPAKLAAISARRMPAESASNKRARQTPRTDSVVGGLGSPRSFPLRVPHFFVECISAQPNTTGSRTMTFTTTTMKKTMTMERTKMALKKSTDPYPGCDRRWKNAAVC
ncbi:hypothetical protein JG688_00010047 [Phytophthora aleatoria]|uniref:Uncharacterized protein n=1 Tax=Phytophthora aleatoria TaxID=2496075 RepID=A0A8J5MFT3_9STRA|nr:hypothetical protein JG688_00010047 [Phytophthora aleatoria]